MREIKPAFRGNLAAELIRMISQPVGIEEKWKDVKLGTEILQHILLFGPPGTGKTALAKIVSLELSKTYGFTPDLIRLTPLELADKSDIRRLINKITPGCVIFIDEIHGIGKDPAEALYSALQDGEVNIKGLNYIKLPPITFIGATTEPGSLFEPFRDRFPIQIELEPLEDHDVSDLLRDFVEGVQFPSTFDEYHGQKDAKMLIWMHLGSLNKMEYEMGKEIVDEAAHRALGIPRIAKNIMRHLMALAKSIGRDLQAPDAELCFELLGIDPNGLHKADRRVIKVLLNRNNTPMGMAALASSSELDKHDLENIVEPRLVRTHYLERTPRGRMLTPHGIQTYSDLRNS
jgi:holliday junction DNA helicase RuvB